MDLNCVVIRFTHRSVFPVLAMKLSLLRLFGHLTMNDHVRFLRLFLNPFSRVPFQVGGDVIRRQVSVLFLYHPMMDDPHYLSFLSLSYHICKIEIITSTSYSYREDPML